MKPRTSATPLSPAILALTALLAATLAACIYVDEGSNGAVAGEWPGNCSPYDPDAPCLPCWDGDGSADQPADGDRPDSTPAQPGDSDRPANGDRPDASPEQPGDGDSSPGSGSPGDGSAGNGDSSPDHPDPQPCVWTMDCPQGVCVDGKCLVECTRDDECGAGRACFAGMCEAAELPGPECNRTSDCAGDSTCIDGQCRPPCTCDGDCLDSERCAFGGCLPLHPAH